MLETLLLFCIMMMGNFLQATTGFGCAILVMAVWPLFLPVTDVVISLSLCNLITFSALVFKNRKYINYKLLLPPLTISLIANYIGLNYLVSIDNALATKILGVALFVLVIYFYKFSNKIKMPKNAVAAAIAGACSGLMNGLFSIPGPPIVLYYSAAIKDKREYLGTLQTFFYINIIFKLCVLISKQGITHNVATTVPWAIVAATIGMTIGMKLFERLPDATIKKAIYVVMAVSGIWYMVR